MRASVWRLLLRSSILRVAVLLSLVIKHKLAIRPLQQTVRHERIHRKEPIDIAPEEDIAAGSVVDHMVPVEEVLSTNWRRIVGYTVIGVVDFGMEVVADTVPSKLTVVPVLGQGR